MLILNGANDPLLRMSILNAVNESELHASMVKTGLNIRSIFTLLFTKCLKVGAAVIQTDSEEMLKAFRCFLSRNVLGVVVWSASALIIQLQPLISVNCVS